MATETPAFLDAVVLGGLVLASLVTLLAGYRVLRGPTIPDRVVGLEIGRAHV